MCCPPQVLSPQYNSNLSRTNDIFNHSNLHFWQCVPPPAASVSLAAPCASSPLPPLQVSSPSCQHPNSGG